MKSRVIVLTAVLLQCAGSATARAQADEGLRIVVQVSVGRGDGGDRRSTAGEVDPGTIGSTSMFAFSRLEGQCGTGVGRGPMGNAGVAADGTMKRVYSAWSVKVTPLRQAGEAVTFRVQWLRSRDNGKPSTVGDDSELTLRPGQTRSLDLMPQSADTSAQAGACAIEALSLAVGVVHRPDPDRDRRLVAVDLWLLERLADGTERSQPLTLRGLYNQPIPFYFDTVTDGTRRLDVFGDLQVARGAGTTTTAITITTRSRVGDLNQEPRPSRLPIGVPWPPPDYVGLNIATIHLGVGEVVSVPLPPVGSGREDAALFAPRALSFRIRVRQIR